MISNEQQRTIAGCNLPPTVETSKLPTDEIECELCNELVERSEINSESDCCEPCTDENFCACESCGTLTHDDEIHCGEGSLSDQYFCESCYNEQHTSCVNCREVMENSDSTSSESGDDYCQSCYDDNFFCCQGCGEETALDECHSTDDGMFCETCAPNDGEECEQKHNWTGTDDFDKIGSPRKFGVELESYDDANYSDWIGDTDWGAKPDGSTCGMEFVSPPMWGNDGYDSVMEFCQRAENDGIRPNNKCGFHLHIDLSDTNSEQRKAIALAYHYTRKMWADFIALDRRDTGYAAYSTDSEHHSDRRCWNEESILNGDGHPTGAPRYLWLNWQSYAKFETVEIRSHEPTFDGQTVINWIKAHTLFVDYIATLSVGEVTRIFSDPENHHDTLRQIWPTDLADHYIGKMHLTEMGAA